MLQATKAIWWRRLRKEMRVWRNVEVLIKGKRRNTCLKELRKNNDFEAISFSTQYTIKWNPNTGAAIRCFVCWQVPTFPICVDCSNCSRTVMYVTTADAYCNRENITACSIRAYGLLKCRCINITERMQSIISLSDLYATLHFFKITFIFRSI